MTVWLLLQKHSSTIGIISINSLETGNVLLCHWPFEPANEITAYVVLRKHFFKISQILWSKRVRNSRESQQNIFFVPIIVIVWIQDRMDVVATITSRHNVLIRVNIIDDTRNIYSRILNLESKIYLRHESWILIEVFLYNFFSATYWVIRSNWFKITDVWTKQSNALCIPMVIPIYTIRCTSLYYMSHVVVIYVITACSTHPRRLKQASVLLNAAMHDHKVRVHSRSCLLVHARWILFTVWTLKHAKRLWDITHCTDQHWIKIWIVMLYLKVWKPTLFYQE